MIWGIIGFVALIIIFLSFTWNPEPTEDEVVNDIQEVPESIEEDKPTEWKIVSEMTKEQPIEEKNEACINYHESDAEPFVQVNFPTIDELKIIRNTKLAKVYNHFVVEGKVGLVDFPKLNIAHANTYVFKLRRMLKKYDIIITTHLDEKKKFVEYRISNKL